MPKLLAKLLLFVLLMYLSDAALAGLLKYGMEGRYGINRPVEIVFVGNSRVEAGIDPDLVSERLKAPSAKYAIGGCNTSDRLEMIRYWLAKKSEPVKCLVYGVDQYTFRNARFKGGEDAYRHFYPFIDSSRLAEYVKEKESDSQEYYLKKLVRLSRFNNQDKSLSVGYFLNRKDPYDERVVDPAQISVLQRVLSDYTTSIDPDGIALFDETMKFLAQKKIPVILLYLPTTDVINDLNGARYEESLALLRQFAEKYGSSVRLCDMFTGLSTRYDLFADFGHLNRRGQEYVSQRFAEYLKESFRF